MAREVRQYVELEASSNLAKRNAKECNMHPKISVIVPTLNEAANIQNLLDSLGKQTLSNFEIIVVDGGSTDETVSVADEYSSKIIVQKGLREFPSRNIGAKAANGDILLFTCADVVFPRDLFAEVARSFANSQVIALTGPDIPQSSPAAKIEYGIYNFLRLLFCSFPKPMKRFSTSTNFLAVRRKYFERTGGFVSDVNGDGILGRQLSEMGEVKFALGTAVFISPRRFFKMGFTKFNSHYLYVLENFFPFLSRTSFLKNLKRKSGSVHSDMHMIAPEHS